MSDATPFIENIQRLELEAAEQTAAQDYDTGLEGFRDFYERVNSGFSSIIKTHLTGTAQFSAGDLQNAARRIVRHDYLTLRNFKIFCPPGLRMDFVSYASLLARAVTHHKNSFAAVVQPANAWMGMGLNNESLQQSLQSNLKIQSKHNTEQSEFTKQLTNAFASTSEAQPTEILYGQAFTRNNGWSDLAQQWRVVEGFFEPSWQKEYKTAVESIAYRMGPLTEQIIRAKADGKLSRQFALDAYESINCAARNVEFHGLLMHLISEFETALKDSQTALKKAYGF